MKEKKRITTPKLKHPQFQGYTLYINNSLVECTASDIDHVVDLILAREQDKWIGGMNKVKNKGGSNK